MRRGTKAAPNRHIDLKTMLEDRRRELMNTVQDRIHHVRAGGPPDPEVLDEAESSDVDIQEEIDLALIQMHSETLTKINDALRRLGDGAYGQCFECGDEIAEARLRAPRFVSAPVRHAQLSARCAPPQARATAPTGQRRLEVFALARAQPVRRTVTFSVATSQRFSTQYPTSCESRVIATGFRACR